MYAPGTKLLFQKALLGSNTLPGDIDQDTAIRWAADLRVHKQPDLSCLNGRYLNTFMVGSDPEFCFTNGSHKANATDLGLRPALAFGSDQNARLVELRPAPSRSVVEHIASLLVTMRHMIVMQPNTLAYGWRCGAYFDGDGMGGHVHFGRKRPSRAAEIAGLDGLARVLRGFGMFPEREWETRSRGDTRGQMYGLYGDFRLQAHGYEYRTLPSWLRNPSIAFAVVTLSKLVVLDPAISAKWELCSAKEATETLLSFVKLYAGRDDDARILYHILLNRAATLRHVSGCFRDAWGLSPTLSTDPRTLETVVGGVARPKWDFVPTMIWPTEADSAELLDHFIEGTPLTFKVNEYHFQTSLPKGFSWLYSNTPNTNRPGTGDFFCDLVTHSKRPFHLQPAETAQASAEILAHPEMKRLLPAGTRTYATSNLVKDTLVLIIPRNLLADLPRARALKKVLLNGDFPVWKTNTATEEAYKAYKPLSKPVPAASKSKRKL